MTILTYVLNFVNRFWQPDPGWLIREVNRDYWRQFRADPVPVGVRYV